MKKVSLLILVSLILLLAFTSCDLLPESITGLLGGSHEHKWTEATCTSPKSCECGATEGEALGHDWTAATCTSAKTCKTCNATEGEAAGHDFADATCTSPKTCKDCGVTTGKANGHDWNAPDCTSPATCKDCGAEGDAALGHKYVHDCDWRCSVCGELTRPLAKHDLVLVEQVDSTCTEYGTAMYVYCKICDGKWLDLDLTKKFEDMNDLKLDTLAPHEYEYECSTECSNCEEGTREAEHEYTCDCDTSCDICLEETREAAVEHEYFYACDAWCMNCYEFTNPNAAHKIIHVEAKASTCIEYGNIEYWTCEYCGGCWDNDKAMGMPLNKMSVTIFEYAEHTYSSDCDTLCDVCDEQTRTSEVAHEYFYACDKVCMNCFDETNPDAAHNLLHFDAVEAGCHDDGNLEYWRCTDCGTCWLDEELTMQTNVRSVVVPAKGSNLLVHMDAVEAGCHSNGCIEHWICYECERVWQDEALTQLTNSKNVIIPAKGSNLLVHMDAVEPGCHFNGNIEYWICYECNQVWQDEALTQLTNVKNVIIPELGGNVIHVEAKDPGCFEFGNIEHWYCEECEQVWQDEARTQLTNHMNVKIAPTHANVAHIEAVDPGCHYQGNLEYWVCNDCGYVWTDANLTEVSNIKNVIIPELGGNVIHVEAKAPTCNADGNIEYWYCEECEQVWQDEARTQLTNRLNVILGNRPDHEYNYDCDKNCKNCGEEIRPEATHDYGEATCDEAATCSICGVSTGEPIGCDFVDYVYNNDATCFADGTETANCVRNCGNTHTRTKEGTKLTHTYTNYVSNGDATCTADGTETAKCDHGCETEDTRTEEGSKLTHTYTNYVSNGDATCTADGTETAKCDHGCGTEDTRTEVDSRIEHSFTQYVSDGTVTCTTAGKKTASCDYGCGATNTVDEEALGHAWLDATCAAAKTCERCGVTEGEANAVAHNLTVALSDTAATYTCSVCNYSYTTEIALTLDGAEDIPYISAPDYSSTIKTNDRYEVIRKTDAEGVVNTKRGQAQIWLPGNNKEKGFIGFNATNKSIGYISFSLSTGNFKNRPTLYDDNGKKIEDRYDMFSVELADFTYGDNYDVEGDGTAESIRWTKYWAIPNKAFLVMPNDDGTVTATGYNGINLGTYTPGEDGWTEWIDVAMSLNINATEGTLTVHYYIQGEYVGSSTVEHTTLGKAITNIYVNANMIEADAGYKLDDFVFGYSAHHHDTTPTIAYGMVTYSCECGMSYSVSSEYLEWDGEGTDSPLTHSPNGAFNRYPTINADGTWSFMFTPTEESGWAAYGGNANYMGGQIQPWMPADTRTEDVFTDFSCEANAVGIISFKVKTSITKHANRDTSISFGVGKPRNVPVDEWNAGGGWTDDQINLLTIEDYLESGTVVRGGLSGDGGTNLILATIPAGGDGWSEWFDVVISIAMKDDGTMSVYYYINGVYCGSDTKDIVNGEGRILNPQKIEALQISGWTYAANTGIMFDDMIFGYTAGGHNTLDGKSHVIPENATCSEAATCSCGYTGILVNHDFAAATCLAPATCKSCGLTSGDKVDHDINFSYSDNTLTYHCDMCDNSFVADYSNYYDGTGAVGDFSKNNQDIAFANVDGAYKIYSSTGNRAQYMWFLPKSDRTNAAILKDFSCEKNSIGIISYRIKSSADEPVRFVLMEARNGNATWDADGSWNKNSIDVLTFNAPSSGTMAIHGSNMNGNATLVTVPVGADGWSEWVDVQLIVRLKSDNTLELTYIINGVNYGTFTRDLANPGDKQTISDFKIECIYFTGYTTKGFMVDDVTIGYSHHGHWTFDGKVHNEVAPTCSSAGYCTGCAWTAPRLDSHYYAPSYADGVVTYTCAGCGDYYLLDEAYYLDGTSYDVVPVVQNYTYGYTSDSKGTPDMTNGYYSLIRAPQADGTEYTSNGQYQMWVPKGGNHTDWADFSCANNASGIVSFKFNGYSDATGFDFKLADGSLRDKGFSWTEHALSIFNVSKVNNGAVTLKGVNGTLDTITVGADNFTGWLDVTIIIDLTSETVDGVTTNYLTARYWINGKFVATQTIVMPITTDRISSMYITGNSLATGTGFHIDDLVFGYTTNGLQELPPIYNSVVDVAEVTSETLKTIRNAKIKQLDQVNAEYTLDAEAAAAANNWYTKTEGTPVYVLANGKDGSEVEALYFSRTNPWFNATRNGEEYGMSSFRFVLNRKVDSITFDYLIRGSIADLGHFEFDKTNTDGNAVVLDGNAYLELVQDGVYYTVDAGTTFTNDGEWHTMTIELSETMDVTEFLFNLYHFEGEMLVANLEVEYEAFYNSVIDVAEVTSETLKAINASKIKQFDQANPNSDPATNNDYFVEGGTPVYVKANKDDAEVEALYFSRSVEWLSGSQNSGWSEFRVATDSSKLMSSITFDYLVKGTLESSTEKSDDGIGELGTSYVQIKDGSGTYIDLANSAMVADGEWHTMTLNLDNVSVTNVLFKLYHFQGEMLFANLVINYAE